MVVVVVVLVVRTQELHKTGHDVLTTSIVEQNFPSSSVQYAGSWTLLQLGTVVVVVVAVVMVVVVSGHVPQTAGHVDCK